VSQSKPSALPDPTEIAGRYQVEKRLGAGAFGVVYKAKDSTLGRDVAIKTIRLEGLAASTAGLDELLRRFKTEARTAALLKHPNIVTIYDVNTAEDLTYLVMEFVDGIGLDRIVADSGKLSVERAAALTAQVADALDYAWRNNKVVHRDIKPANIMVEAGDRVKVTDFGIAKATESGEHLTQTGSLLGTPSYMSPEQARGGAIDGRSDLFSLGCVFYELLAGRKAFRGDSITALLFKIITEEPPPLHEIDPLIPDEAVRIVAKALSKAPETRYQSGREFADDLLALAQGYVPTIRQAGTPTENVTDHPTISLDPTAQATRVSTPRGPQTPPTTAVPPTVMAGVAGSPPPPPPPLPPPPVVVARGTAPSVPAAPRAARPVARPARRAGGGAGLVIGLAAVGLVFLGLVGVGGWWLLHRQGAVAPTETSAESPEPTTLAAAPASAASTSPESASTTPASAPEAGSTAVLGSPGASAAAPASPPGPPAPSAGATRAASEPSRASTPTAGGSSAPAAPPPALSVPPAAAPPSGPSDTFLDTMPNEGPDGRTAGRELSQAYSSANGGTAGFGTSRSLRRRALFPPHGPAERPAVMGLRWILVAENAHHHSTGRYGTLQELVRSGDLPLRQLPPGGVFERNGYRFTVTASGDSFRADARPLAPGPRAFYVDDSGYVLLADE
jgi:serine/threonine protein kinase